MEIKSWRESYVLMATWNKSSFSECYPLDSYYLQSLDLVSGRSDFGTVMHASQNILGCDKDLLSAFFS